MRTLVMLAFAATAVAAPTLKPKTPEDAVAILGTWDADAASVRGQDTKPGVRVVFNKDGTCSIHHGHPAGNPYPAKYTLDPKAKPKALDWTNEGNSKWQCLYQVDGDKLILLFTDLSSGARAEKLEPGEKATIYYLSRVKE